MSEFPIPITMSVEESTMEVNMSVAETATAVTMSVASGTMIVPNNYGLITWNGHYLRVS